MHMLGGMGQQVAMLVNRAALDRQFVAPQRQQRGFQTRRAIDDDKLGPLQAALIQIIEELSPWSRPIRHQPDGSLRGSDPRSKTYSRHPFGGKTAPHAVF